MDLPSGHKVPKCPCRTSMQLYRRIQCRVYLFVFMSFSGLHFLLYKIIWSSFLEALLKKNTMQRSLGFENFNVSQLFLHHPPTIAFMLRRDFFWAGAVFAACFLCLLMDREYYSVSSSLWTQVSHRKEGESWVCQSWSHLEAQKRSFW